MLRVYICEDNDKQLERVTKAVKETILTEGLNMQLALATSEPYEVLSHVENESEAGIYFLDVELNSTMDGIELASKIRKYDTLGFIIFVTTHPEFSYLTFKYKVEALDYIVKDGHEELKSSIKNCLIDINKRFANEKKEEKKCFYAKCGQRVMHVPYEDIILFETAPTPHKVTLHTINRRIEFYGHIGKILDELDDRFYQCHKSYIINRDQITMVDKKNREIYLNGENMCVASVRAIKGLYNNKI